jgi:hypothetical protein
VPAGAIVSVSVVDMFSAPFLEWSNVEDASYCTIFL